MTEFDPSQIQWKRPWLAISTEHAPQIEAELHREMCTGHALFGHKVTAIGRRQDCSDTLFYLGESLPRFAVVHLTWQVESSPKWPSTTLFDSLEIWLEQCMNPDAQSAVDTK